MTATAGASRATISVLASEHVAVRALLEELARAEGRGDREGASAVLSASGELLGAGLDAHIGLEDDVLFPAIAEGLGAAMVDSFRAEHREIERLRDAVVLAARRGDLDGAPLEELCERLGGHMQREDELLFPAAIGLLEDRGEGEGAAS